MTNCNCRRRDRITEFFEEAGIASADVILFEDDGIRVVGEWASGPERFAVDLNAGESLVS